MMNWMDVSMGVLAVLIDEIMLELLVDLNDWPSYKQWQYDHAFHNSGM